MGFCPFGLAGSLANISMLAFRVPMEERDAP
jgi:hypothetical protein